VYYQVFLKLQQRQQQQLSYLAARHTKQFCPGSCIALCIGSNIRCYNSTANCARMSLTVLSPLLLVLSAAVAAAAISPSAAVSPAG
jgi:hypothetical protein